MEYLKHLHYILICFLIYISDLNSVFNKAITLYFADGTLLNYASKTLSTIESVINYEIKKLSERLRSNKIYLNSGNSEVFVFCSKNRTI